MSYFSAKKPLEVLKKNTSQEVNVFCELINYLCNMALSWKYYHHRLIPIIIFGVLLGHCSYAQTALKIDSKIIDTDLNGYLSVAKNLKLVNISTSNFEKSNAPIVNFGLENDENWVKLELENIQNHPIKLVLFLDQTFLKKVAFYQYVGETLVSKSEYDQNTPLQNLPSRHSNFKFSFDLSPRQKYSIYLMMKVDPIQGVSRALLRLSDEHTFVKNAQRSSLSFGIFIGFLLLSFITAILLFYFGKKQISGVYGVYILVVLAYYLSNSGYLNSIYPNTFLGSARFSQVALCLGSALHIYFIDKFLNLKALFSSNLRYFIKGLVTVSFLLAVIYLLFPIPEFFPKVVRFLLLIISLFILYLTFWGVRKKNSQAQIYCLAVLPSVLLIVYFLLSALNVVPLHGVSFALAFPFTVFEVIVYGVGLVYQFSQEKIDIETKLAEEQSLLAHKVIAAQEQERQRVAQDLHDDLGSTLSMLKVRLEEMNREPERPLKNEIAIANKAVDDLRQISYNLMPTRFLERGLISAIQEFLRINDITSQVDFFYGGNAKKLSWEVELGIFRITKELLTNAIKHANATKIDLQLIYYQEFIYLSVEDNGVGFKEKEVVAKGNGLKSINLRVSYLHGKLNIESSPTGTSALIEIPYEPHPKDKNTSG